MQLVAILTTLLLVFYLLKNRSNIIAIIAQFRYGFGYTEQALKMYKFAWKFGKMKFEHRVRYAYLTLKEGDVDESNKLFNLIGMDKLKPEERAKLKESHALVAWKRGEVADAIEMLEYVHKHYTSTTTYGSLGYMYIHSGNLNKALEYNLEGYDYNKDNDIIVDNLAYTYLKMGDYENAEKYYKELLEMDPKFPEGYFEYGKYLIENKGEKEQGIELVKKALNTRFSFLSMITRREILDYLEQQGEDISKLV
ncbi:MAG: tetratricopeptide repeat protein [Clostridia bacterium]|nr:tetratricopeptide repeat protein [Clostridia bacterium]